MDGKLTADEMEYGGKAWSQAARDAAAAARRSGGAVALLSGGSTPIRHQMSHHATVLTVTARNATRAAKTPGDHEEAASHHMNAAEAHREAMAVNRSAAAHHQSRIDEHERQGARHMEEAERLRAGKDGKQWKAWSEEARAAALAARRAHAKPTGTTGPMGLAIRASQASAAAHSAGTREAHAAASRAHGAAADSLARTARTQSGAAADKLNEMAAVHRGKEKEHGAAALAAVEKPQDAQAKMPKPAGPMPGLKPHAFGEWRQAEADRALAGKPVAAADMAKYRSMRALSSTAYADGFTDRARTMTGSQHFDQAAAAKAHDDAVGVHIEASKAHADAAYAGQPEARAWHKAKQKEHSAWAAWHENQKERINIARSGAAPGMIGSRVKTPDGRVGKVVSAPFGGSSVTRRVQFADGTTGDFVHTALSLAPPASAKKPPASPEKRAHMFKKPDGTYAMVSGHIGDPTHKANLASARADQSGSADDHMAAAEQHERARSHQDALAVEGPKDDALAHRQASRHHMAEANRHRQAYAAAIDDRRRASDRDKKNPAGSFGNKKPGKSAAFDIGDRVTWAAEAKAGPALLVIAAGVDPQRGAWLAVRETLPGVDGASQKRYACTPAELKAWEGK